MKITLVHSFHMNNEHQFVRKMFSSIDANRRDKESLYTDVR